MILKKDGKIVINNGKILTNDGELNPSVATKVQEALSNSLDNKDAIEKIISGETPIGSIISFSVDGKEIETDMNGNINLDLSQYKGGSKINYSSETGKLSLLDSANNVISEVNLPLESFVKSGQYNAVTKEIELTLTSDEVIKIPVEKLIDIYKADEKDITLNGNTFELTNNFKLRFNNKVDKNQLANYALKSESISQKELDKKQDNLISGANIKTINGLSLLGTGNLNFTDIETTDGTTITYSLGSANETKWYRLAKLLVPEVNASGTFIVNYYESENDIKVMTNSTTFYINAGVNNKGEIISEVCPLVRIPNTFNETTDNQGSAIWSNAGLVNVRIEKSDDGMFVVGLFNKLNPTEKHIQIDMTLNNAVNLVALEEAEMIQYANDNSKIDLTDSLSISPEEKIEFEMNFMYDQIYNVLNGGGGSAKYLKNNSSDIIFGIECTSNDYDYKYIVCNNVEGPTKNVPIVLYNEKEFEIDKTLTYDGSKSLLEIMNEKNITQVTPYATFSLTKICGYIKVECDTGTVTLNITQSNSYNIEKTVNSGEEYTTPLLTFTDKDKIKIQGGENYSIKFITYMEGNTVNYMPMINIKFKNSFASKVDPGILTNDFYLGTDSGGFIRYTYGIEADLVGYDLYDLNNKIEELENKTEKLINGNKTIEEYGIEEYVEIKSSKGDAQVTTDTSSSPTRYIANVYLNEKDSNKYIKLKKRSYSEENGPMHEIHFNISSNVKNCKFLFYNLASDGTVDTIVINSISPDVIINYIYPKTNMENQFEPYEWGYSFVDYMSGNNWVGFTPETDGLLSIILVEIDEVGIVKVYPQLALEE